MMELIPSSILNNKTIMASASFNLQQVVITSFFQITIKVDKNMDVFDKFSQAEYEINTKMSSTMDTATQYGRHCFM